MTASNRIAHSRAFSRIVSESSSPTDSSDCTASDAASEMGRYMRPPLFRATPHHLAPATFKGLLRDLLQAHWKVDLIFNPGFSEFLKRALVFPQCIVGKCVEFNCKLMSSFRVA
jgi:hypothetical protein